MELSLYCPKYLSNCLLEGSDGLRAFSDFILQTSPIEQFFTRVIDRSPSFEQILTRKREWIASCLGDGQRRSHSCSRLLSSNGPYIYQRQGQTLRD